MDNKKELMIVMWIIVIFGAFFLAKGLTGKVVMDVTASDFCSSNANCSTGKVCCLFMENKGYCNTIDVCYQSKLNYEKPQVKNDYTFEMILGVLILIAILIGFYAVNRNKKQNKKIIKKKTVKKKKRR